MRLPCIKTLYIVKIILSIAIVEVFLRVVWVIFFEVDDLLFIINWLNVDFSAVFCWWGISSKYIILKVGISSSGAKHRCKAFFWRRLHCLIKTRTISKLSLFLIVYIFWGAFNSPLLDDCFQIWNGLIKFRRICLDCWAHSQCVELIK